MASKITSTEVVISKPLIQGRIKTAHATFDWDYSDQAPITMQGHLPFFIQFLETGELFSRFVDDCPLDYRSNNAPSIKDVMGTAILSILSGHSRYCHASTLFGDTVAAELMGLHKIVSPDSLLRALKKMDQQETEEWIHKHLMQPVEPLLQHAYVLDIDSTVKTVYGSQEGAQVGYNPHKPGRPSYCYHTYMVGTARLVLDADVLPGNQTAGCYSHPGLWRILDHLPDGLRPSFIRADIAYGNEATMAGCEQRNVDYLFKLSKSPLIKTLCAEYSQPGHNWKDAGRGWQGIERQLRLDAWSVPRRVIVLRRPAKKDAQPASLKQPGFQNEFEFVGESEMPEYEWAVLVTSLNYDICTLAQLYRDRGDCENVFDELKNQWGWSGFTTQKIGPTRIMAGLIAVVYNWWNIFCRLADPTEHMEAITSRPSLQNVVARLTRSGGRQRLHLAKTGKIAEKTGKIFKSISDFLEEILTASQLNVEERWALVLERAYQYFLKGLRVLPVSDGNQLLMIS